MHTRAHGVHTLEFGVFPQLRGCFGAKMHTSTGGDGGYIGFSAAVSGQFERGVGVRKSLLDSLGTFYVRYLARTPFRFLAALLCKRSLNTKSIIAAHSIYILKNRKFLLYVIVVN